MFCQLRSNKTRKASDQIITSARGHHQPAGAPGARCCVAAKVYLKHLAHVVLKVLNIFKLTLCTLATKIIFNTAGSHTVSSSVPDTCAGEAADSPFFSLESL